jgi:endonuclease-3
MPTKKPAKAKSSNAAAKNPSKRRKKRGTELKAHAAEVLKRLKKEYPDAHCELDFGNPLQLLIATILSAQCTDKRVNMVTPELFRAYPDAESLSSANPEELENLIRSTGFFRNKTRSLLGMSAAVAERHGGNVPSTMDELVKLPGVGRKTANVVLGNAFAMNEGVVVDTHVGRLAVRLGLTSETDPVKVEKALMLLFPRDDWALLSHLLIFHGRRICIARAPRCRECVLNDICPSARV